VSTSSRNAPSSPGTSVRDDAGPFPRSTTDVASPAPSVHTRAVRSRDAETTRAPSGETSAA